MTTKILSIDEVEVGYINYIRSFISVKDKIFRDIKVHINNENKISKPMVTTNGNPKLEQTPKS